MPCEKVGDNPVFCWHGEPLFWKRARERHPGIPDVNWVDLCKMFREEPITIRGCMNFSLKNVVRACKSNGLISVCPPENFWEGDLNAMVESWRAYSSGKTSPPEDVVEYNKFHCTCLCELLKFVRERMM